MYYTHFFCGAWNTCATIPLWKSEIILQELAPSLNRVGLGNLSQVTRLSSKFFYPLSHLTVPLRLCTF